MSDNVKTESQNHDLDNDTEIKGTYVIKRSKLWVSLQKQARLMTAMLSHAHALQWSILMKLLFFLTDKKKELIKVGKISARLENLSYSLNNEYLDQVSLYCSVVRSLAPKFWTSRRQITTIKLTLPKHSVDIYICCSFVICHLSVQPKSTKYFIYYYRFSRRENR